MLESSKRRQFIKGAIGASAIGLAGCTGLTNGTTRITMGGSTSGSATYGACSALQKVVNENSDSVKITVQSTSGSGPANFHQFDSGNVDGGGFDNYAAAQAKQGTGDFAGNQVESLPYQGFFYLIAHLYIVATEGSNIQTTADLAGKNVWLNPPGTSVRPPTDSVLKNAGLWDKINRYQMGRDSLPGAMEEGKIDAIVVYGVNYNVLAGWEREIDSRFKLHGVKATDNFVNAIKKSSGTQFERVAPYGWKQDMGVDNVATWNVANQFRWGPGVDKSAVQEIAKIALNKSSKMHDVSPIFPVFDKAEDMTKAVIKDQIVHSGMVAFWKEKGVWNDAWKSP